MSKKDSDSAPNRALVKLRREVVAARARWEAIAKERSETSRTVVGERERSKTRILYIARYGKWFDDVKSEMLALQTKIEKAGYVGAKKPRTLWLPTVIENSSKIRLTTYQSKSVRKVTLDQARAFVRKAECATYLLPDNRYVIRSITGRDFQLRVTCQRKISYVGFTEWALCICSDKSSLPRLRKCRPKPSDSALEFVHAICTYKNSALYEIQPTHSSDDHPLRLTSGSASG